MDTRTGNIGDFDAVKSGSEQLDRMAATQAGFSGSLPQHEAQSRPTAAKLGYRQLSDEEAQQVLDVRKLGEQTKALLDSCRYADPHWKGEATQRFREAHMLLVRAITKPDFF